MLTLLLFYLITFRYLSTLYRFTTRRSWRFRSTSLSTKQKL